MQSIEAVREAVSRNWCQAVNLVLPHLGGIHVARQLAKWLEREGIEVWAGSIAEMGIGSTAALHFASLLPNRHPTDVASSFRCFKDEIIRPWLNVRGGEFVLGSQPGLGIQISEKALHQYSRRSEKYFRRNYL